jgi:hypothetical protein
MAVPLCERSAVQVYFRHDDSLEGACLAGGGYWLHCHRNCRTQTNTVFDVLSFTTALEKLWARGSLLLFALATGLFCAFLGAEGTRWIDAAALSSAGRGLPAWTLVGSIGLFVLAIFKRVHEARERSFGIVPVDSQSFWHAATQKDGRRTTQIVVRFDLVNLTQRALWLTEARLLRPRTPKLLHWMTHVRQTGGRGFGSHVVPPSARTEGSVQFLINDDLGDIIRRHGVKLKLSDQFGRWHPVTMKSLRGG